MTSVSLAEKIMVLPGMVSGQPHIAGTRFTVKQIAVWHEFMGKTADEIASEFGLELSDIYAALSYFFENRTAIMQEIEEENDLIKSMKLRFPSKMAAKRG